MENPAVRFLTRPDLNTFLNANSGDAVKVKNGTKAGKQRRMQVNVTSEFPPELTQLLQQIGKVLENPPGSSAARFHSFDPKSDLLDSYKNRFMIHCRSSGKTQKNQVAAYLLDCQSESVFQQLVALCSKQGKQLENQEIDGIWSMLKELFEPEKYVLAERHTFWTSLGLRKAGESAAELASRARMLAKNCKFDEYAADPTDRALLDWFLGSEVHMVAGPATSLFILIYLMHFVWQAQSAQ